MSLLWYKIDICDLPQIIENDSFPPNIKKAKKDILIKINSLITSQFGNFSEMPKSVIKKTRLIAWEIAESWMLKFQDVEAITSLLIDDTTKIILQKCIDLLDDSSCDYYMEWQVVNRFFRWQKTWEATVCKILDNGAIECEWELAWNYMKWTFCPNSWASIEWKDFSIK